MKKFVKVNDIKEVTPPGLDGHRYLLSFDVGSVTNDGFKSDDCRNVTITSSGTLQAVWGQDRAQFSESSASAAMSMIIDMVSEGRIGDLEGIDLNTYTAPEKPPSSPKAIAGTIISVPERPVPEKTEALFSFLSNDISEVRDQINAISKGLIGDRLLELPQERAILDIYKPTHSSEEFRSRIQSLAGICTALNKKAIGKKLGKEKTSDVGSIMLLSELLEMYSTKEISNDICNVLKNVNELRKGYPAHGDNTEKFLRAHSFFKIKYPVSGFQSAWESILGMYFEAMKGLVKVLSDEYYK